MRYLGIDYGHKRIGLSYGDELGIAVPIEPAVEPTLEARLEHIQREIERRRIGAIVIGYPYNMDGTASRTSEAVNEFIERLKSLTDLPIHTVDETLTSYASELPSSKKRGAKAQQQSRNTGQLDSRAAALILQDFLSMRGYAD